MCPIQGWHLMHRVILYCRVIYLHIKNVELSTSQECREIPKTLENSKKIACYNLENEFSLFFTLDVSSNEFLTHQLNTSNKCRHQFTLDIANPGPIVSFFIEPFKTYTVAKCKSIRK